MSNNVAVSDSLRQVSKPGVIRNLQEQISALPQPDCYKTTHRFANGMYCRTFWMPAGHLVIGALQRYEHLVVILSGEVLIYAEENGIISCKAGDVFTSPGGSQRAVGSVTDAELMTVHRLPDPDERDLDKIWTTLVDADGMPRLYDHNNRLRDPALTSAEFPQLGASK